MIKSGPCQIAKYPMKITVNSQIGLGGGFRRVFRSPTTLITGQSSKCLNMEKKATIN